MGDLVDKGLGVSIGGVGNGCLGWGVVGVDRERDCWDGDEVVEGGGREDGVWVHGEVGLGGGMALGGGWVAPGDVGVVGKRFGEGGLGIAGGVGGGMGVGGWCMWMVACWIWMYGVVGRSLVWVRVGSGSLHASVFLGISG